MINTRWMATTAFALFMGVAPASALAASLSSVQAAPQSSGAAGSAEAQALPTIAQIREYLIAQGLQVGEIQSGELPYVQVRDGEHLAYVISFFSCEENRCGDLQFSAGFSNPQVTLELVNRWNAERRFSKSYFEAPSAGRPNAAAMIQQDTFLFNGGVAQIAPALSIWRSQLAQFALHVGYFVPDAP